jgi:phosphatidate cytidylyltransferase
MGTGLVLSILGLTFLYDIAAFAVGSFYGKRPLAPTISPKKSWEGLLGSGLACLIVGGPMVMVLLGGTWMAGALLGVAIAITATLGDLSESVLKRDLGIKDMGSLLPGHGGVMDRLDSLLISAPVAYLLLTWMVPPT